MCSTSSPEKNFEVIEQLTLEAGKGGAKMVFLPENFNYMGSLAEGVAHAQSLNGAYMTKYKALAKSNKVWMSLGGFQEQSKNPNKYYNSQVILNDQGEVVSVYRKLYLFDVKIDESLIMNESRYVLPGEKISDIVQTPIGNLGMGICYDIRFPELFRSLCLKGAEILSIPAAFLEKTGYAHWEILLRARAIENSCFVIASAQDGRHESGRVSYGHSQVIDPWGIQISISSSGPRLNIVDLDHDLISKTRQKLPVLNNFKLL